MSKIRLADAIAALRTELSEAVEKGEGADLKFTVDEIELELSVAVETSGEVGADISFNVLGFEAEAGAGGQLGKSNTQTVKLKLSPSRSDGDGNVEVSSKTKVDPMSDKKN